jgi:hypothetical protein
MIVTEAQAGKMWCPIARVHAPGNQMVNRFSTATMVMAVKEAARTGDERDLKYFQSQEADTHCIGSKCMLWRFTGYRPVPSGNDEAHGCCGMAGEPLFAAWDRGTDHHGI